MSSATEQRRVALVTGAARGLARGVAVDLAAQGYHIAFTFRPSGTPPDETAARIAALGSTALTVACDHEREGDSEAAVSAVERELGRIDVLVHAVGPLIARSFRRSTLDDYRRMIDGNLRSAVESAFAALPGMRARGFGRLVFFAMNGAHATLPARNMSLYAAAKAAVVSFARTLALEEGRHGITSNAIEPGDIRNKALDRTGARAVAANNPTGHAGSWEDVASAVRFLVADDAAFINGAVLSVTGGLAEPYE